VLQTTGSAAQTGLTGFFSILPVVLAGLLGGVLTEQLGVQVMLILLGMTYVVTALSMAFIPPTRQMNRRTATMPADL
jgi:sugar phosphate permease